MNPRTTESISRPRVATMTQTAWTEIREEMGKSGTARPTILLAVLDLGLMLAALRSGVIQGSMGWTLLAIALQTLALVHGYLLQHEAVHKAVFASPGRNAALGHLMGWLLALPFLPRQRSHALHHAFTGHPEADPANRRAIRRFGSLDTRSARRLDRLWRIWFPFLVLNERIGLWLEPFRARRTDPHAARTRTEVRWVWLYLAGYGLVAGIMGALGILGAVLCYYLPALALTVFIEELANLPHHAETPLVASARPLPLWEQHTVTHACRGLAVWSSFVLLHFNLHIAHHLFPWLPWYRLPEAQRHIAMRCPELGVTGPSELRWGWTRRRRPFLDVMGHYFLVAATKRSPAETQADSSIR